MYRRIRLLAPALAGVLCMTSAFALDGSFDPTWAGAGRFVFNGDYFFTGSSLAYVEIESSGRLFLAGPSFNYWWLGELSAAGQFIPTFGASDGSGRITSCQFGFDCGITDNQYAVLPQPDGKYLVLSDSYFARTTTQAHALDAAGVSGGTGHVSFSSYQFNDIKGYVNPGTAIALQPDGKVLLAGQGYYSLIATTSSFGLLRLNGDLSLDTTFNTITDDQNITFAGGALVRVDANDFDENAGVVLLQPDGRIVLVGVGLKSGAFDGYLDVVRLKADGSLDDSFGVGGTAELLWPAGQIAFNASIFARLDPAGRIVVALSTLDNSGMLVARVNPAGTLDSGFGTAGFFYNTAAALSCTKVAASALAFDSAGRILVGGYCDTTFLVERIRGDTGALDTSFGVNGLSHGSFADLSTQDGASALALDASGHPIVGGYSTVAGMSYAAIGRLTYDLIYTNNFEIAPRGCLLPNCN
jgi:uncharacterized delta-60 repeat protein